MSTSGDCWWWTVTITLFLLQCVGRIFGYTVLLVGTMTKDRHSVIRVRCITCVQPVSTCLPADASNRSIGVEDAEAAADLGFALPSHYLLERRLMKHYNKRVLPRRRHSWAVKIKFRMQLYQIVEVVRYFWLKCQRYAYSSTYFTVFFVKCVITLAIIIACVAVSLE